VTGNESASQSGGAELPEIDTSVTHAARVYDYLLGGTANFEVDREAAQRAYAAWPGGLDAVRADVRQHRALLGRVVRYLAGEAGIRQFLDIGAGIPQDNSTHAVAQQIAPRSRIVYVDYDPVVLAYASKVLTSTADGAAVYVDADLRDPDAILRKAADTLDFSQPAAIVLFGVLHFFADTDHPDAIVASLTAALAPGSYLAVSHLAKDVEDEALSETFDRLNQRMSESVTLRSRKEIARFFTGLDLLDPGVVQQTRWRPDLATAAAAPSPMWCAVGRKA
jgi:O-methyltransferase involved in polyketide biosynthesis